VLEGGCYPIQLVCTNINPHIPLSFFVEWLGTAPIASHHFFNACSCSILDMCNLFPSGSFLHKLSGYFMTEAAVWPDKIKTKTFCWHLSEIKV